MTSIKDAFAQYGDDYYAKQGRAYTDYANPQLEDQYRTARENAMFDLARSGNLNSSTGARAMSDLQRDYNFQQQNIASKAKDVENSVRQNLESERDELTGLLYQTGENETVTNSALNRAKSAAATPGFSPLGELFRTYTNLAAIDRTAQSYGGPGFYNRLNSGKGSGRTIN
jgi:hypothetical protein